MYSSNIQTLVEIFSDSFSTCPEEAVEMLKELREEMMDDVAKFTIDLKHAIMDYCEENEICYDCCVKGEMCKHSEDRPYGDMNAAEEMCRLMCPECDEEI